MRINSAGRNLAWSFRGLMLGHSLLEGGALPPLDGAGDSEIANSGDVAESELRGRRHKRDGYSSLLGGG